MSVQKVIPGMGLLVWSGFLGWIWLSGNVGDYAGNRTQWVVPTGAIVLGLAALGYFGVAALRLRGSARGRGDALGLVILLVPVVAIAAVPKAELGAYAAGKKSGAAAQPSSKQPVMAPKTGPLTLVDLNYASQYDDAAASVGVVAGRRVAVTGFVTHPEGQPPGTFAVTRFGIACCIADAEPFSAQIDPKRAGARAYEDDTWVTVSGTTVERGRRVLVVADRILRVDPPKNRYFSYSF